MPYYIHSIGYLFVHYVIHSFIITFVQYVFVHAKEETSSYGDDVNDAPNKQGTLVSSRVLLQAFAL